MKKILVAIGTTVYLVTAVIVAGQWTKRASAQEPSSARPMEGKPSPTVFIPAQVNETAKRRDGVSAKSAPKTNAAEPFVPFTREEREILHTNPAYGNPATRRAARMAVAAAKTEETATNAAPSPNPPLPTAPLISTGPAVAGSPAPRHPISSSLAPSYHVPGLAYITITNNIIWPVPSGAAFFDITGPTELKLAPFPEGAVLSLAIRNPQNFPVSMLYPTNGVFQLDTFGPSTLGRYLLHISNVKGEIWITK